MKTINLTNFTQCVIFSDIQFCKKLHQSYITESGLPSWTMLQTEAVQSIFRYCRENEIKVIIFNGDLFEEKTRIPQDLYNFVWQLFYDVKDEFILIFNTGNHDLFTITGKSSLKPFTPFINIISEPTDVELQDSIMRIIPYGQIKGNLKLPNNPQNKSLCLATHEDISGLTYGAHDYQSSTRLKPIIFADWDYVFNGHIHKPQELNNIINIGSSIQQSFSEEGEQKSFIHLKNKTYNRIELNVVEFKTLESIEIAEIDDKNFFRIKISAEESSDPIFKNYNVSPYVVKSKEREIRLKTGSTEKEDIKTYVDITETNLDKKKLIKLGKEILNDI